jgi:hypothetical protein
VAVTIGLKQVVSLAALTTSAATTMWSSLTAAWAL